MFVSILTEKVKKAYWFPYDFVKRVAIFKNGNATKKPQFSIRDRNSWKNWTVVNEIVTNFGYLMFGVTSLWNHKGILRPLRVWLVFLSALSAMYFKMAYFEWFIDSSTSKYTFSRHFDEKSWSTRLWEFGCKLAISWSGRKYPELSHLFPHFW